MTEIAVLCEECGMKSRVPAFAAGKMAICPGCRAEFVIRFTPEPERPVPTVYPPARKEDNSAGVLIGLSISAFLVPLAWLLAKSLGPRQPVFTYGLPLSIAFAAAGLGIGVALAKDWSITTRVKSIIALLLLAWGFAAFFFYMKAEWVEGFRRDFVMLTGQWQEFTPPSRSFRVRMPGNPKPEAVEVIRGWPLTTYRVVLGTNNKDSFNACEGSPGAAAVGMTDDQFFAAAREGAEKSANGTLVTEQVIALDGHPGREYYFKLADNATNRTIRVYRIETKAIVLMTEGAFLPPDAKDVQRFFNSLQITQGR